MTFSLEVDSDKGTLQVLWSNLESLAKYSNCQIGFYGSKPDITTKLLFSHFREFNIKKWRINQNLRIFDLPTSARILDIGSGVSVIDLLLYSYVENSKFFLLDGDLKNDEDLKAGIQYVRDNPYSENCKIYNSWEPVIDAITTSNFDKNRFEFLSPSSNFPEDLDLVTSYASWCLNYPKEIYWIKTINSLKKGGKLALDVRVLRDRDVIGEITEELKSKPIMHPIIFPKELDKFEDIDENASAYKCVWIKNI